MSTQEQIEQLRAKVKRVNDFLNEIPEQYLTGGVPIYRHQLEQELAKLAKEEAEKELKPSSSSTKYRIKLKDPQFHDMFHGEAGHIGCMLSALIENVVIEPCKGD